MPTLYQIACYARMFRLLRGRRPTARETMRYFSGADATTMPMRSYVDASTAGPFRSYRFKANR